MANQEQCQKASGALKNAQSLLIIADPKKPSACLCALALIGAYEKGVLFEPSITTALRDAITQSLRNQLWDGVSQRGETTISVDGARAPVKELRYERDTHTSTLHIHLSPAKNTIAKEDIHIKNANPRWDAIVLLGIENRNELSAITQNLLSPFIASSLIYIGENAPKETIAALSCVCDGNETLAELLNALIGEKRAEPNIVADCLLAMITASIQSSRSLGANTFALGAALLEQGADRERARILHDATGAHSANTHENKIPPEKEKVKNRHAINYDEAHGFYWTVLSPKTAEHLDARALIALAESLNDYENARGSLVIAHSHNADAIRLFTCYMVPPKKPAKKELVALLGAKEHDRVIEFSLDAKDPVEAERKALKLAHASFEYARGIR